MTLDPATFSLFFFFLNHGAPILKEVVAVLVTASSYSFLISVTVYSFFTFFQVFLINHNLKKENPNHKPPTLISSL